MRLGDRRRAADERRAGRHLDDQLADAEPLALGELAPLRRHSERVALVAHPAAGDRDAAVARRDRRRAAARRGRRTDRSRPHTCSTNAIAPCGLTCCRRMWAASSVGFGVGVADDRGRGRDDLEVVAAPAVAGQPSLDVGVERLAVGVARVAAEDHVGVLGGELAPTVGVAGLDQHRVALRAARHVERPVDRELPAAMVEGRIAVGSTNTPRSLSATTAPSAHVSHSWRATSMNSSARS